MFIKLTPSWGTEKKINLYSVWCFSDLFPVLQRLRNEGVRRYGNVVIIVKSLVSGVLVGIWHKHTSWSAEPKRCSVLTVGLTPATRLSPASNMSWKRGRRETVLGGHCWHVAQGTLPEIQKGLWEKLRVEREGVACINWRKNGLIMVFSWG